MKKPRLLKRLLSHCKDKTGMVVADLRNKIRPEMAMDVLRVMAGGRHRRKFRHLRGDNRINRILAFSLPLLNISLLRCP